MCFDSGNKKSSENLADGVIVWQFIFFFLTPPPSTSKIYMGSNCRSTPLCLQCFLGITLKSAVDLYFHNFCDAPLTTCRVMCP